MEGKGIVQRVGHVVLLHLLGMAITRHIKSGVLGPRLSTVPFCTTSISSQLRSPWNEIAKKYAVPLHRSLSARRKEKKIDMVLSNAWHNKIQYFRICLTLCQDFLVIFPKRSTKLYFTGVSCSNMAKPYISWITNHRYFTSWVSFTSAYKSKPKQAHLIFFMYCQPFFLAWKLWWCVVKKEDGKFGDQWWSGTATLDGAVILLCRKKGDD